MAEFIYLTIGSNCHGYPHQTAAQQISTSRISTMAETEGSTILDASVAGPTNGEANAAAASLHLQAELPGQTESSRKRKNRKVNRAEGATTAKKYSKAIPEPGLPQGVTETSAGNFSAYIQWGGKSRCIGIPEKASAAYRSVKKGLDDAKLSAVGAHKVNNVFEAAKTIASEVYGGIKRGQTKRKSKSYFIDLTGVPPQPLILKNQLGHTLYSDNSRRRPTKEGSSKYTGIYYDAKWPKWKAQIMVEGKVRAIGYYDTEEDAAADYARAAYKYKKRKGNPIVYGGLDLSGVPGSLPLIRSERAATGFVGVVKKHTQREKIEARIRIGKKLKSLGSFNTPEEAALIYAKAMWYLESKPQGKEEGTTVPSALVEEPSSSDTGLVAGSEVTVDEKGGNGGDGRDVDHDHLDNAHDDDPVDRCT